MPVRALRFLESQKFLPILLTLLVAAALALGALSYLSFRDESKARTERIDMLLKDRKQSQREIGKLIELNKQQSDDLRALRAQLDALGVTPAVPAPTEESTSVGPSPSTTSPTTTAQVRSGTGGGTTGSDRSGGSTAPTTRAPSQTTTTASPAPSQEAEPTACLPIVGCVG